MVPCYVFNVPHNLPVSSPLVMESGRKRKLREKEFTKEQLAHFKKLRKEQHMRRRKRKNAPGEERVDELKVDEMMIAPPSPPANAHQSNEKQRKLERAENCLPGGTKMDHALLERSEKDGEESHPGPPANARHSDEKKRQ